MYSYFDMYNTYKAIYNIIQPFNISLQSEKLRLEFIAKIISWHQILSAFPLRMYLLDLRFEIHEL